MSGVLWRAITGPIASVGAINTIIQVVAATDHGLLIDSITADIDPNSVSVISSVEVWIQTGAGTSNALVPTKVGDDDETLEVTARDTFTSTEPTQTTLIERKQVYISGSSVVRVQFNFVNPRLKVSGGERLALVHSPPSSETPKFTVTVRGEE